MDGYDGESTVLDIDRFVASVNLETTLVTIQGADEDDILPALNRLELVSDDFEYVVGGIVEGQVYVDAVSELDFDADDIIDQLQAMVERIAIESALEQLNEMDEEDAELMVISNLHNLREVTGAFDANMVLPYRAEAYAAAFADDDYPTGTVDEVVAMLEDVNDGETMPEIEVTIDSIGDYDYVEEQMELTGEIDPYDSEWMVNVTPTVVDEDGDIVGVGVTMETDENGEFEAIIMMDLAEESGEYYIEFSTLYVDEEIVSVPFYFHVEPREINELDNPSDATSEHFAWLIEHAEDLGVNVEAYEALNEEERQAAYEMVVERKPEGGFASVQQVVDLFNAATADPS
ncbi:hypothetical protein JCM19037_1381 [Geomicrobium sp. JCM 19037]|uniref:hypothetical protein n=1 Tax=Geomicrobium sp. JCM 19037 TaxID=1460634 RepID=UPI00045F4C2B|nr:hypothetical protein [Geomicrobium sp. JCM 19037]GAK03093.1 hypothetical protein JCM19037_1381 [Geomicrobium sp. JCM 19037]